MTDELPPTEPQHDDAPTPVEKASAVRRALSITVRIAFAVAGIAFIAWTLDWNDQVELAAGTTLPDGTVLEAPVSQPLEGKPLLTLLEAGDVTTTITLPDGQTVEAFISLTAGDSKPDGARFKPGIMRTLREADVGLLLLGLLLIGPVYPIQMFRWWLLLRARGIDVSLWQTFRLVMVGSFFNFCMPVGTTGGDVVKGYYAARNSDRRADTVMSVVVDRAVGMCGLLVMAGVAGLFMLGNPQARVTTMVVWGGMAALIIGAAVFFSPGLRKVFHVEAILSKLPGGALFSTIDQAAFAYRDHKGVLLSTVFISVGNHLTLALSTATAGYALGMDQPLLLVVAVIPISFFAAAIPFTYQGLGAMEGVAILLLGDPVRATDNQIFGMLMLIRLFQVFYSLFGSIFLLRGDIHLHPERDADAVVAAPDGV